jgi:hypothetical protein
MALGGWSSDDAIEPSLAAPTEANTSDSMSAVALLPPINCYKITPLSASLAEIYSFSPPPESVHPSTIVQS